MFPEQKCILRIILPAPLRRYFDYLPPKESSIEELQPGIRVRVPFDKHKERIGLLLSVSDHSNIAENRLKRVTKIIDKTPVLPKRHLSLLEWASSYYHHPIGEVFFNALPKAIRQGKALAMHHEQSWQITPAGIKADDNMLVNAPVQSHLLELFRERRQALTRTQIQQFIRN